MKFFIFLIASILLQMVIHFSTNIDFLFFIFQYFKLLKVCGLVIRPRNDDLKTRHEIDYLLKQLKNLDTLYERDMVPKIDLDEQNNFIKRGQNHNSDLNKKMNQLFQKFQTSMSLNGVWGLPR